MAVAEFTPSSSSIIKKTSLYSSQLSYVSTHQISYKRRFSLRPLQRTHYANICCSVTSNEVQAPVVTNDLKKKPECFGVFCLTYDLKAEEETSCWKKLINVSVSGAAGMIANHLLFKLAAGEVFGPDQPIALKLLGSERSIQALEGVAMELEDSLYPLLREVSIGIDPYEVFQDAEWALLIGAKPRGPGMERADLLDINGQIFAEQGKALNAVASRNVKVIVVGNPCNTNALICLKNAPDIPAKNFHALTRLDENRAKCQLALKAGVFYDEVSNVTIFFSSIFLVLVFLLSSPKTMAENSRNGEIHSNLPNFLLSVRLKYVKLGYHYLISNAIYLLIVPILVAIGLHLSTLTLEDLITNLAMLKSYSTLVVFLATLYFMSRPRNVYLIDFACYKPHERYMISKERLVEKLAGIFDEDSLNFQKKILERSGLSDKTYIPVDKWIPSNFSLSSNQHQAKLVIVGAIDNLLAKTGVKIREIGIVIVNSSMFNPTPSLSAMIVNHYKLGVNVITYNLGGMGCSAGLISVDLANRLLQGQANTYALIVSTEVVSAAFYTGKDKSKLIPNMIFRMGASAILLSNRFSDRWRSKYQLMHVVRTHKGADDRAFGCVYQDEEEDGKKGMSLSKDLMAVAGEALKTNITTLGPLVLPMSEQLLFFASLVARNVFKRKIKPYIPDFKMAFEHFCIHAGGRAVLDELQKNLDLSEVLMEPSRMTLYRFGNTSSSSVWYNLAYSEAKGRIKKGDRAWQIGFGSGFKCNSAVWRALRNVDAATEKNAWTDEIEDFPVQIPC